MKRILRYTLWVTIIVWVCSCQEYKMVEYGEGGQINFMGKNGKLGRMILLSFTIIRISVLMWMGIP